MNNVANSHFPSRLNPPRKDKAKDEELRIFKKVEINPSLLSVVQQIPKYVKFLKELLYKEDRHSDKENNIVCQNVYELIKKDMPKESLDPGMFILPCVIGNKQINYAMLDIQVSINVMPICVFRELGLNNLQKTNVSIQIVDRSYVSP